MLRAFTRLLVLAVGGMALAIYLSEEFLQPDADEDDDGSEGGDARLVDTAAAAGPWGTFHVALKAAELVEALDADGPFTVFAPTDDAFGALGETLDELLAQPDVLARILQHHVVEGKFLAADLAPGDTLSTLAGTELTVERDAHGLAVSGAAVVETDVTASNGVLHGLAQVLTPPEPTTSKKTRTKKS